MAWLKVEQTLRDHYKICNAADELGIEPAHMTGAMVLLWLWGIDNAPTGSLKGFSDAAIARGAMYYGDAHQFVKSLVNTGLLDQKEDGELLFHDWSEYTGKLIEQRQKELERKEKAKNNSTEIPRKFHGNSAEFHGNSTESNGNSADKSKSKSKSKSKNKKDTSLSPKTGERDESTESTNQPSTPSEKIRELWNDTALSLGKVREIVGKRKIMLGARWKEHPDLDWWATYFDRIEASAFLTGKNDRGWKARFDWVIDPTNMNKILEGCYDDRRKEETHELTEDDYLKGFARTAEWCE